MFYNAVKKIFFVRQKVVQILQTEFTKTVQSCQLNTQFILVDTNISVGD